MGNSVTGSSQEKRTMAYYDELPRSARLALQEATLDWATRSFLKRFERGMKAKDLVKHIRTIDKREVTKQRKRVWGPDYPLDL